MTTFSSAAGGAPIGGGGSLHDILRHISAETKETKQALSVSASVVGESDANAIANAATDAKNRQSADVVSRAKRTLAQLGPALLLRGGRGRRDQTAQSSLGKRPRVASASATTTTTDGLTMEDTVSSQACLDAFRRERDQLAADLDAASTTTNGNSVQQMRDLAAVYLFGLERVGALQDLRQAPDAILPGNFVEQPVVDAATAATVATTANVELAPVTTTITKLATNATEAKAPVAVAASTETKTLA
jgi:hypothetical protein